jgi:hypothetical protein
MQCGAAGKAFLAGVDIVLKGMDPAASWGAVPCENAAK